MAENDDIKDGLKIETKSGIILYDSSWIAGVNYEEDPNEIEETFRLVSNEKLFLLSLFNYQLL